MADEAAIAERLDRFTIETPSWGYADTGTRFGKFVQDGAAITLRDKLEDAAQVHAMTGCCPSVALHVLWDFDCTEAGLPTNASAVRREADSFGLRIGALNPNVFQDQVYKFGSVASHLPEVRRRALDHLIASARMGPELGSTTVSLWFADGTNYPGQASIRQRISWFNEALCELHGALPAGMTMLIEYKPFEPAFYHTDIADWGMAASFARASGVNAKVLVDTGHHLQGTNVEHIVAFLIAENMLGGFHFNDRKYGDDDLTMGSIDPYQLFRIFFEIAQAEHELGEILAVDYMIDQSHNLKPKVEAMIQSVCTAQEQFCRALLVDHEKLREARTRGDVVAAERCVVDAYSTDVRPFLAEYRVARGLPADPIEAHRQDGYAERAAADRRERKPGTSGGYA